MEHKREKINDIWLALKLPDCSPRYTKLLHEYGSATNVYESFEEIHRENPQLIKQADFERMQAESPEQLFQRIENTLNELQIQVILLNSKDYPTILKNIASPPNILFVRGKLPSEEQPKIGIVGSRKCTSYGIESTKAISTKLSESGACIVSGLAEGIDAHASSAALDVKNNPCPTIAVLGSGIDVIYPKCNESLYYDIIERGAVISQYCPGTLPTSYTFPKRNKVIAGLSSCLIIAEAAKGSGAIISADYASKFGRKVFCIPGRITDWQSEGANSLIESNKATMLLSIEQIINDYIENPINLIDNSGFEASEKPVKTQCAKKQVKPKIELDETSMVIYNALLEGERTFDELCVITGFSPPMLNLSLTTMEFSRIIKQSQGRTFCIFCDI